MRELYEVNFGIFTKFRKHVFDIWHLRAKTELTELIEIPSAHKSIIL